jgi:methionine-rich copper-binding protein CopC
MKVRARLLASVAAVTVALWAPQALAGGAPEYVSSEPAKGEELHEAPERVEITFSEPLDPSSDLAVADDCGRRVDDGDVEILATQMSVGVAKQPAGKYTVRYSAVGLAGATGSSRGDYSFTVHAGPACPGGSAHQGHGGGGGAGAHDGHEGDAHATGDHEHHGEDHSVTSGDHDHTVAVGGAHGHDGLGHVGQHEPGDRHGDDHGGNDRVEIATPRRLVGPPLTSQPPGASTAVLALVLAGVFGISGGWVLRAARSR